MNWYKRQFRLKYGQVTVEQELEDILISNNSSFVYLTDAQFNYFKRYLGKFYRHPNGSLFFELGDYIINKFPDGRTVLGRRSIIDEIQQSTV